MYKEDIEEVVKELEQAKSNILRGVDIESSALILEKAILDGYILAGGRIDILKLATRQILYFIEDSKVRHNVGEKHILDYVKENVKLKEENEANKKRIKELEEIEKVIDLIKNRIFVTNKEREEILKIQENHLNKNFEMCAIQYFKKKVEEMKDEK